MGNICTNLCINKSYEVTLPHETINNDKPEEKIEKNIITPIKTTCIECHGRESEDQIISLECKKCFIGGNCIFDRFQALLNESKNISIFCSCNLPISYHLFEDFVSKQDLKRFLAYISNSNSDLSNYLCECGQIIKHKNCKNKSENCLKCLQTHKKSQTCLDYFKSRNPSCDQCEKDFNELSCGCFLCLDCNLPVVKESILQDPKNPKCPKCRKNLNAKDLNDFFQGQSNYKKFLEKIKNTFECLICYKKTILEDCCIADCKEKFCVNCFKDFIRSSADSLPENSTVIKCPSCSEKLSRKTVKKYLEGNSLKRFNIKIMKKKISESEKIVYCADCDAETNVKKVRSKNTCQVCQRKICRKCCFVYSPVCCGSAVDVEEFGELKDFVSFCPMCNAPVLAFDPNSMKNGCNFLKCSNNSCSQCYFCFLCKKILTVRFTQIDQHYTHYKTSGPFGKTCNTLDKIVD
jgi:hypothetical protein